MADFYKLLTGIVLAVCAEAVLSSMTENESLKKIISAACLVLSMYLLINFSQKHIFAPLTGFLP
ncbi:MAG: hypothetical protein IKD83_00580 [Firmicutes bacterium]|nr:hypothetical protein [Bacillota bacterium]MBR0104095.1 hypothetical protein [Bacillota bacterium]MBR2593105.1 hypothetical protein [Bacillota bacterium]